MRKALVIDDEYIVREYLRLLLEEEGFAVDVAENGRAGLEILHARGPVDVVVTDLVMPETEGIEVVLTVRRLYPGTKILAVSGGGMFGQHDYLDAARTLGAHGVLAKPFDRNAAVSALRAL